MSLRTKLKSKVQSIKTKGNQDVRRGKRRVRQGAKSIKRKGQRDVRRGTTEAKNRLKSRLSDVEAKQVVAQALAAGNQDVAEPSLADRARDAADARAPIDATLDPAGNPRAMEAFASGGMLADQGPSNDAGMVSSPMAVSGSGDAMDDDPLNVASGLAIDQADNGETVGYFGSAGSEGGEVDGMMISDDYFAGGEFDGRL